jgi:hypothetical protein
MLVRMMSRSMYHDDEGCMQNKDFDKFVARQQGTSLDTNIDWAGMRDEWLRNLDSLYREIVGFLREYIDAGSISYSFSDMELIEENIGKYLAKRMDIKIGRQLVSLVPVGTLLVGSKGRVDAVGSTGSALILLLDKRAKSAADLIQVRVSIKGSPPPLAPRKELISWAWKIVVKAAKSRFVDLEKESFLALLMEIANA